MVIRTQTINEQSIVIAEGILDANAFTEIRAVIEKLPAQQVKHIWVDCCGLQQIVLSNGSFSGFLNHVLALRALQVQILLFGVDEATKRLLRLLKLEPIFQITASLDEAYLLHHSSIGA
ncbi:STAS domain-containing protein [Pontibacter chitinilyticus]|uniref:STAS domain-containing protein n=1 Tax=Pontibacter chitinilyticus TaxID=2674989 RepID=UPI00321B5B26